MAPGPVRDNAGGSQADVESHGHRRDRTESAEPGSDGDEGNPAPKRPRPIILSAKKKTTDDYGVAARYITRVVNMHWEPIATVNAGIYLVSLDSNEEAEAEIASASEKKRALYEVFILLSNRIPGLQDSDDWSIVRERLDHGKRAAKTEDNRAFKTMLPKWKKWDPPIDANSKQERGVAHPECAMLLAPICVTWANEGERDRFIDHYDPPMSADGDWPAFLYAGYIGDPKAAATGLLRSDIMVRAVKTVLFPATVANAEDQPDFQSNRKSKADAYGVDAVTPGLLAYAAVSVRYALSAETSFQASGGVFDYQVFYNDLVEHLNDPACKQDTTELLEWWNTTLFRPKRTDPVAKPSSMVAKLRRQAIERQQQALEDGN